MSEHQPSRAIPPASVAVESLRFTGPPLTPEGILVVSKMLGGLGIYVARAGLDVYSPAPSGADPEDSGTPEERFQDDLAGIQSRTRTMDYLMDNSGDIPGDIYYGLKLLEGDFGDGLIERLQRDLGYMARMTDTLRTSGHPSDRCLSVYLLDPLHRALISRAEPFDAHAEAGKWEALCGDQDSDVSSSASEWSENLSIDVDDMVEEGRTDLVAFRDALNEVVVFRP